MFSNISSAVPPLLLRSFPTLNTLLSNLSSRLLFSALTVTSLNAVASDSRIIFFKSTSLFSLVNGIDTFFILYPT